MNYANDLWIRWSPGSHSRHKIRDPAESEGPSSRPVVAGPYKVVSERVLVMDSRRAADKGKAPMGEEEPRELLTRARRVAVTIGEPNIPGWTARYEESESMKISDDEQDNPMEGVPAFDRGEGVST
ncbi:hypothetical protein ACLOJK_015045 [Asimina triloba]